MSGKRAALLSGSKNIKPVAIKHQAMFGKVNKSKKRRPKVSMVQIAGHAKMKLMSPNPKDARRHWRGEKPPCSKIVEE